MCISDVGARWVETYSVVNVTNVRRRVFLDITYFVNVTYYVPALKGIKQWCASDVCLSRTSGLSREQRGLVRLKFWHRGSPRHTWLGHHFQGQSQRSTCMENSKPITLDNLKSSSKSFPNLAYSFGDECVIRTPSCWRYTDLNTTTRRLLAICTNPLLINLWPLCLRVGQYFHQS